MSAFHLLRRLGQSRGSQRRGTTSLYVRLAMAGTVRHGMFPWQASGRRRSLSRRAGPKSDARASFSLLTRPRITLLYAARPEPFEGQARQTELVVRQVDMS